ncbi:MAG: hypothetical protein U0996_05785 [Planctomycetaceae bacterium]
MNEPATTAPPAPAQFSIARVLVLVVILGAVGGGIFYWMEQQNRPKPLVKFTGQVLYKGAPVTTGTVLAQSLSDRNDMAIGPLDSEGKFSLETNGEPGVRIGRHKVAISATKPTIPPTPLVPANYVQIDSSPLVIEATADVSSNTIIFTLEGELPAESGGEPPASAQPPGGNEGEPKDTTQPTPGTPDNAKQ